MDPEDLPDIEEVDSDLPEDEPEDDESGSYSPVIPIQ